MTQPTITTQSIADILAHGVRTAETRAQTKLFLEDVARFLRDEVGPVEADVGTRAHSDSRAIQFIDRAYFFVAPELRETYFPMLAVFLMPGLLWWGVYAWGKRSYAESVASAFQELGIDVAQEMRVETGAFKAIESWGTGGHAAAGRQLTPDEVRSRTDLGELAEEIAQDLARWWRRLQPELSTLRERLDFVGKEGATRSLAAPFNVLFSTYKEANQVLDFFAQSARKVGLRDNQDDRFALTLRHNQRVLRLNFGNWMLVDYNGREKGHLNLALLSDLVPPQYELIDWGPSFARTERPVQLFMLPLGLALNMPPDLSVAYDESMAYLAEYFLHWGGSRWRSSHQQVLFEALFDDDKRDALLTGGFELVEVSERDAVDEPVPFGVGEPYTTTDFLHCTHLTPETTDELLALLHDKRQIVLYGPPGTGKTYVARELGRLLTGQASPPPEQLALIQFHPAYGYEDFIEGIRPRSRDGGDGRYVVDYPVERGIFRRFCEAAREVDGPAVLIIDEINRGNIARIFGELMFLLEYRDAEIILPYSGDRFSIPENVYLIGTMNTADRSIALVDFALRRRFHFYPFRADAELLARWLDSHPVDIPYLLPLYRRLSEDAIDDPDYAIGPSYFMDKNLTEKKLQRVWERSIIPYLAEYHLDKRQSVDRWRWDADLVRTIRGQHDRD